MTRCRISCSCSAFIYSYLASLHPLYTCRVWGKWICSLSCCRGRFHAQTWRWGGGGVMSLSRFFAFVILTCPFLPLILSSWYKHIVSDTVVPFGFQGDAVFGRNDAFAICTTIHREGAVDSTLRYFGAPSDDSFCLPFDFNYLRVSLRPSLVCRTRFQMQKQSKRKRIGLYCQSGPKRWPERSE
jgi:hypothetical protein